VCVYNFTPEAHEKYEVALPEGGKLRLVFMTDGQAKKSAKAVKKACNGLPYAASLTLPPMSALFYKYTKEAK